MTVSSDLGRADYNGNGATVNFPVPFRFLEDSHLRVIRTVVSTGAETVLTLDSVGVDGYSVTGAGEPSGGEITVVTAPTGAPTLQKLTILCDPPVTQLTDYITNDPFPAETHERALDKLTMIVRALKEKLARAFVLQESVSNISPVLPQPIPDYVFGWASDGLSVVNVDLSGVADLGLRPDLNSSASGKGAQLVRYKASGTGTIERLVSGRMDDFVSVKNFGVKGDGVTDDTAAFQAALDNSLHVWVPNGDYVISGTLKLRSFQTVVGVSPHTQGGTAEGTRGTARLVFTGASGNCIEAADMASPLNHWALHNLTIRCTGTYSWLFRFPSMSGGKIINVRAEATLNNVGGFKSEKVSGFPTSWVCHFTDFEIRLPSTSTARTFDSDLGDSVFLGGSLGGGGGAIIRGTGGFKFIGVRMDNSTGWGITVSHETESLSQHQFVGCQIEENDTGGLLIDGDANDALVETDVNFVVSGCQFRNPSAVDIQFQNATGPVLSGGTISGCMFTSPTSTRIARDQTRWKHVTVSGNTHNGATVAENNHVGTEFVPSVLVLAKSAVAVTHTGDTNDTTLATIAVPANAMGVNGRLRITTLWSHTNNANNKNLRVKFNGTNFTSIPVTTTATSRLQTEIANRNAANSQVGAAANYIGMGSSTGAVVTSAHDTTASQNLTITTQLANAADSVTLEGYLVELVRGE